MVNGFCDVQTAAKPTYLHRNGLRFVKPYIFKHENYAKKRWIGQSILQMYKDEFKMYNLDYIKKSIKYWKSPDPKFLGKIFVNSKNIN